MKIGIITQRLGRNYGGTIQNYALQFVLKKLGHVPVTMMQEWSRPGMIRHLLHKVIDPILWLVGREARVFIVTDTSNLFYKEIQTFVDKYINVVVLSEKEFKTYAIDKEIEGFVVGSDQVWRPRYNDSLYLNYLGFTEEMQVKRVAYAASFGVDSWEYSQQETELARRLIMQFDAISVREKSGIILCGEHLKVNAVHVLDPTMLLDEGDYQRFIPIDAKSKRKYLFVYLLDATPAKRALAERISKARGLDVLYYMPEVHISARTGMRYMRNHVYKPIEEWLRGFYECDYVLCDSFHGAVFSIIFNRPFAVISNSVRGNTRFESLLSMFHLEDRMVDVENCGVIPNDSINWTEVNDILDRERNKSLEFLKKSLSAK